MATTLVLFCSHFHQIKEDKEHGKNSPLVRLGAKKGAKLIPWIVFVVYVFQLFIIINGFIPILCVLFLISFPQALKLINLLKYSYNKTELIKNFKFIAIKFQTLNGIGLIAGLIIDYLIYK